VTNLFSSIFGLVLTGWPILLLLALYVWWQNRLFQKSAYSEATGNGLLKTFSDKGLYGEYLTFRIVERCPGYKYILPNLYLPKGDGGTTEIDIALISESGVFVFESKNYSGWIFGNEKDLLWTQVLNKRTKIKLYNPIKQNQGHIAALKSNIVGADLDDSVVRSYIVFSERCELKQIAVTSPDVVVLKRNHLRRHLLADAKSSEGVLDRHTVDRVQHLLNRYANVDSATRQEHIANIKKFRGQSE
jgi:hypothetical protein